MRATIVLLGACAPPSHPVVEPRSAPQPIPIAPQQSRRREHHALGSNPFAGAKFWADPRSDAWKRARALQPTRPNDAALLAKVAQGGGADWIGDWIPDVERWVAARIAQLATEGGGALPLFVAYDIPKRDCGQYSSGGMASATGYRAWISAFARGIGERRAVVVLEPDALLSLEQPGCLSPEDKRERTELLRFAVDVFESLSETWVYLDAGHSGWIPAGEMARRLEAAGIERADGFALNVSNYRDTPSLLAYGKALSALVGAKPFVIDTSRNGNGPPELTTTDPDAEALWCNPEGRALGTPPTGQTGEPSCHAFLWIKRPGESDGECNGGPKAGAWFERQALELARRAKW